MNTIEKHPYRYINGLKDQLNLTDKEIRINKFKDGGIWFPSTKTIVCGTFPPKKEYFNRKGYLYYSSPKNKFWKHIDKIFETRLYINSQEASNKIFRVENSLKKIEFIKKLRFGFIDIYTQISRKKIDSSIDKDIIPCKTIFDDNIFNKILESDVENIIFVYSDSYKKFLINLYLRYSNCPRKIVREYMKDNISLRVEKIIIGEKQIFLTYCPIHGNLKDISRLPALKKAIEYNFN